MNLLAHKNLHLCYLGFLLLSKLAIRASDGFCPTTSDRLAFVNKSSWHGSARQINLFCF